MNLLLLKHYNKIKAVTIQTSLKTESSYRTLPMTDSVYHILKAHKKQQNKRKEIMGNYYIDSDYICTWNNGNVISPNYLTKTFYTVISKKYIA